MINYNINIKQQVSIILLFTSILIIGRSTGIAQKTMSGGTGVNYFVSNNGNDGNSGTSPESPWETLEKVNSFYFQPGDIIHFRSGDSWRGQLIPKSGSQDRYVKYTKYGEGNKPVIMGSVAKNYLKDWTDLGNNIWGIVPSGTAIGPELISNGDFGNGAKSWSLYVQANSGAEASGLWNESSGYGSPGCYSLKISNSGTSRSHISLTQYNISLEKNKYYKLAFAAKSSADFEMNSIHIRRGTSDFTYSNTIHTQITPVWKMYSYLFQSNITAADLRLEFFLGGAGKLEKVTTIYFDEVSLKECEVSTWFIGCDVGNVILDGQAGLSEKVWKEEDMDSQNKFWYDPENQILKIYSVGNPAGLYSSIECALTRYVINNGNCSYVEYDGIHVTQGGADGISGGKIHHIIIRNCDVSLIGGGFTSGYYEIYDGPARYGNGIQFWGNSHDILVENCNVWNVYDAAISPQCTTENQTYNIYIRNNTLWDFEYGLEMWNRPATSSMHDIYFENNLLKNAGGSWAHKQRPNPRAVFLALHYTNSEVYNISIQNNVFDTTEEYCINVLRGNLYNGIESMVINHNVYRVSENKIFAVWVGGATYMATNEGVKNFKLATGKDINSEVVILK